MFQEEESYVTHVQCENCGEVLLFQGRNQAGEVVTVEAPPHSPKCDKPDNSLGVSTHQPVTYRDGRRIG